MSQLGICTKTKSLKCVVYFNFESKNWVPFLNFKGQLKETDKVISGSVYLFFKVKKNLRSNFSNFCRIYRGAEKLTMDI